MISIKKDTIYQKIEAYNFVFDDALHTESTTSIYAYPRYAKKQHVLEQGFKIHISATVINSESIFDIVIPYLIKQKIHFKVVKSNQLLRLLNEDQFGYTQIGKFITVYPVSTAHFVVLIHELDKLLIGFVSPTIPSDIRLHINSIVYYRYGVISNTKNELILPDGSVVQDARNPTEPVPFWVKDPLKKENPVPKKKGANKLLLDRYILLKVVRQRGKGLVALALEVQKKKSLDSNIRLVFLKQARKLGELNANGIDAVNRLEKEFHLMQQLAPIGICPQPIDFLRYQGDAFMSMSVFGEKSLDEILFGNMLLPKDMLLKIFLCIASKIDALHTRYIYFFDLHPGNVLLNDFNEVLLTDFEYAVQRDSDFSESWDVGTQGFYPSPSVWDTLGKISLYKKLIYKDLFALGNVLAALFCPQWYQDVIQEKHQQQGSTFLNWGIEEALPLFPEAVRAICTKTNFGITEQYQSVRELIQDVQQVAL
jgi:hypothetical protein